MSKITSEEATVLRMEVGGKEVPEMTGVRVKVSKEENWAAVDGKKVHSFSPPFPLFLDHG